MASFESTEFEKFSGKKISLWTLKMGDVLVEND
jgi:hypothetical protein